MDTSIVTEFLENNKALIDNSDWERLFKKARTISGLSGHLYFVLGEAGIEPFQNTLYGLAHRYSFASTTASLLTPKNGVFGVTEVQDNMMSNKNAVYFKSLSDCVQFAIKWKGSIQEAADYFSVVKKQASNINEFKDVQTIYGKAAVSPQGYLDLCKTELAKDVKPEIDSAMKLIRDYAYSNKLLVGMFQDKISNDYFVNKKPKVSKDQHIIERDDGSRYVSIYVRIENKSKNNPFNYEYKDVVVNQGTDKKYTYKDWVGDLDSKWKWAGDDASLKYINPELLKELENRGFTIDDHKYQSYIMINPFYWYPDAEAQQAAGVQGFSTDDFENKEVGTSVSLQIHLMKDIA